MAGQVWEARPDGESTRGKAKFGKRHGSCKWEEENSATRRRPIQCATHPISSAVVLRKGSPASAGASAGIRACVLLCTTFLRRRVTELSNLCGLAQVRAVKKSCHAAFVFSHGSGAEISIKARSADTKVVFECRRWHWIGPQKDGPTT